MGEFLNNQLINTLSLGMDYASVKKKLVANNIANINTSGYQSKSLDFEALLAGRMNSSFAQLPLTTTVNNHISAQMENGAIMPFIKTSSNGLSGLVNNVDIDEQMSEMSKNAGYFNALATLTSKSFRVIRSAISGRT